MADVDRILQSYTDRYVAAATLNPPPIWTALHPGERWKPSDEEAQVGYAALARIHARGPHWQTVHIAGDLNMVVAPRLTRLQRRIVEWRDRLAAAWGVLRGDKSRRR